MSSNDRMTDLPPALPAMWRALRRGYDAEPKLLIVAFVLSLLAALPDALMALWLKFIADGVMGSDPTKTTIAAVGLGVSATLTWVLRVVSDRTQRKFRDRVTIALESHVAKLQASVATIEHHERPDYLDRLSVLRDQVFVLDHMYMSLFTTAGWILRLAVTIGLLVTIHPALVFLALFAIPTIATSSWRPAVERAAEESGAESLRLARHLFDTGTTAPPGKEVRVTGVGSRLIPERRAAWEQWYRPVARTRIHSALWHTLGWAVFGAAYVGAVAFVAYGMNGSPGQTLLVLAAGSRLSAYIGGAVGEIGFLRGIWMDGSRRLAWLEDYAEQKLIREDLDAPAEIKQEIRLDNVSFAYPGTDKRVLEQVNLTLPAGSVVAIVGENGAGKTTLVKLICKMYAPTEGRILVDDVELERIRTIEWRNRLAGAFQDFFRFEFAAGKTVGLGDVPRIDTRHALDAAVERAGAEDVVQSLSNGLDTQLGPTWPGGVEVSFGQWQKLSLARGFMRNQPLLLVLDEPTAALDAETEHALFERFATAARSSGDGIPNGRVTVLVSHRFSTVRMADLIVVLDGSRVVEAGSHQQLIENGGTYAELYQIQASAYQ